MCLLGFQRICKNFYLEAPKAHASVLEKQWSASCKVSQHSDLHDENTCMVKCLGKLARDLRIVSCGSGCGEKKVSISISALSVSSSATASPFCSVGIDHVLPVLLRYASAFQMFTFLSRNPFQCVFFCSAILARYVRLAVWAASLITGSKSPRRVAVVHWLRQKLCS